MIHNMNDMLPTMNDTMRIPKDITISTMKKDYQSPTNLFSLAELSTVGLLSLDNSGDKMYDNALMVSPVRSNSMGPSEFKDKLGDIIRKGLLDIEDDDLSLFSSSLGESFSGDSFALCMPEEIIIPIVCNDNDRPIKPPTKQRTDDVLNQTWHASNRFTDKSLSPFSFHYESMASASAPRKPRRSSSSDADKVLEEAQIKADVRSPMSSPRQPRRFNSFGRDEDCSDKSGLPRKPRRSASPCSR
jgi:hypothetical protein